MRHAITTTRMPARQVPRLLAPPYRFTWAESFAARIESRFAGQLLEELAVEYRHNGGFELPILWDVDDETGEPFIINGIHRVIVAASMNGDVELHRGWLPEGPLEEQFVCLTFEAEVPGHFQAGDEVSEIVPLFDSFRLPSGPWVKSDTYQDWPGEARFGGCWHCPHSLADEIAATVIHRFRAAGGRAVLVDVELRNVW